MASGLLVWKQRESFPREGAGACAIPEEQPPARPRQTELASDSCSEAGTIARLLPPSAFRKRRHRAHGIYNYMSDPFAWILALSVPGFYPEKRTHCDQVDHFSPPSVSTLDRTSKREKVPWALEKGWNLPGLTVQMYALGSDFMADDPILTSVCRVTGMRRPIQRRAPKNQGGENITVLKCVRAVVPSERCGKCAREEAPAKASLKSKDNESYAGPRGSAGTCQGRRGRKISLTLQGVVQEPLLREASMPREFRLSSRRDSPENARREDGADGTATGGRRSGLRESGGGVEGIFSDLESAEK
ncbi:hypothetical protein B0H14DRAFT_2647537 [Mycena olivaceomarginata]|nr:hypothetical protein B0H14DRAFT_2647537 [Mycena olivaceomarginata]